MADYTQVVCIIVFLVAGGAALWRGGSAWATIGLAHAMFAIEMMVDWRYKIHDAVIAIMSNHGDYAGRTPWQIALLILVIPIAAILVSRSLVSLRGTRQLRLASAATLATIAIFVIQLISLHATDQILYARIGPIMLTAWLFVISAATVTWCSLTARRGR